MPCAAHAIAVRDRLDEFGDNTQVVLVTFSNPGALAWYTRTHDLPFPILVDADRSSYRAFGLGRGSVARIYGWKAFKRYYDIYRSEGLASMRRPTDDTLQLGGDFVIDPDGVLSYGFWGAGPDERPTVDELIAAIVSQDHS